MLVAGTNPGVGSCHKQAPNTLAGPAAVLGAPKIR